MNDNSSRVIDVDINEILPNRFQPRIQFDENEILELSDSIKEHGVIQPIVVRTIGDKYEIIAGERRYKASVLAGKETVPVIIRNLNDKDSAEVALIENVQRRNLTPIEEALSYKKILDMGYLTQSDLAGKLGKSQSSVANKIRLLNLPDEVQEALLENKISERHARSLLRIDKEALQNQMLNRIISERLTVRRTDEEIDKLLSNSSSDELVEEKIVEKGEIDMNNNMMPGFNPNPQPAATPNFDIFGAAPQQPVQSEPVAPVMPEIQPAPVEIPVSEPVVPSIPTIEPMQPIAPVTPVMSETQPVAPVASPQFGGFEFDENGNVIAAPGMTSTEPEIPATPVMPEVQPAPVEIPSIPITNPIVEPAIEVPQVGIVEPAMTQQTEDLFSFAPTTAEVNPVQPAPVEPVTPAMPEPSAVPEPIIVTDYTKQYDPVMPQTSQPVVPTVDFKEVINAIRECSSKIEQYGFKIDVEEYDLANLYQVIFKIDKQ